MTNGINRALYWQNPLQETLVIKFTCRWSNPRTHLFQSVHSLPSLVTACWDWMRGEFTGLNPQEWLASNFSLPYHPWITLESHENRGVDHQLKQLLIVKQILLVSPFGNVRRTIWRISILMLGCKGLKWAVCQNFLCFLFSLFCPPLGCLTLLSMGKKSLSNSFQCK